MARSARWKVSRNTASRRSAVATSRTRRVLATKNGGRRHRGNQRKIEKAPVNSEFWTWIYWCFDEHVCFCDSLFGFFKVGSWYFFDLDLVECTVEVMSSFFGNITFGITAFAMLDLIYQWCGFITEFPFIGKSLRSSAYFTSFEDLLETSWIDFSAWFLQAGKASTIQPIAFCWS